MGVAENVTVVPEHTVRSDAVTTTLTGRLGLTVIVIALDVAGFPVAHAAFEVSAQVTTSPFTGIYDIVGPGGDPPVPLISH